MDCGLKASYGLTGLVNTNLFDDRNYEHHLSTGYGLGGKVGLYFGLFNGITADFMFSTNNQEFDYFRGTPATNFTHNIKWSNYDLALLYRLQKDGIYVELGPQLSLLRSVKNADANDSRTDVKAFYQNYYSITKHLPLCLELGWVTVLLISSVLQEKKPTSLLQIR